MLTAGDLAVAGQALALDLVGGLDQGTARAGLAWAAWARHGAHLALGVDAAGRKREKWDQIWDQDATAGTTRSTRKP